LKKGLILAAALAAVSITAPAHAASAQPVEVVVTLDAPPLAQAIQRSRVLSARTKAQRLNLRSATSTAYVHSLATAQSALAARITTTIPGARVTWRYRVVLDGLAIVLPAKDLSRLESIPGVAEVWPNVTYRSLLDRSPELIGADQLWDAPRFDTAGNGIKIGIIDDGLDQAHPFFNATGYTMPPGFPKGNTSYTTSKVIVARAFAPPSNNWRYARVPYDPQFSEHATHVAGIAAGEYSPGAIANRGPLSGVAPNAYLGNYKVLTVPTENFGLNGNAPEIAAGIEAAVNDGMDIINLSLGEPEIEPSRDLVVAAINAAADAGVVPTIAAGNERDGWGNGSISSPGSALKAITAAAVSKQLAVASFSSAGPTPISLQMKPDVSAPGVDITSSVPPHEGTWASFSGTSMAAPHVAGGAALLLQRHPDWTVAQIKSALVLTGKPVFVGRNEAPTTLEGGGLINLVAANDPLIFAAPADLSFGLLRAGTTGTRTVELTDAGGGAGAWAVSVAPQASSPGATVSVAATATVPGPLRVTATAAPNAGDVDATGFLVLSLGAVTRRIPYWFHVDAPKLAREPHMTLTANGIFSGTTAGKPRLVRVYRYPEGRPGDPANILPGPEQVFRVTLRKPVANFGVAVIGGHHVSPRVVYAGDENRLTGFAGYPEVINPYIDSYGEARPVAAAIRPAAGSYDIVFDTPRGVVPGPFQFRFWIDDQTPPAVKLVSTSAKRNGNLELTLTDGGSGVDPRSLTAMIDGKPAAVTYEAGHAVDHALVSLRLVGPGRHALVFTTADYEELKNFENVLKILPNTRTLRTSFRVG
jgi:subtilisin family serine protease